MLRASDGCWLPRPEPHYRNVIMKLGDLLEVVHNAHDRVTQGHITLRDWIHPLPSDAITFNEEAPLGTKLRWEGVGPWPRPSEASREIWFRQPDCLRVELKRADKLARLAIRDGALWWRWDHREGLSKGEVSSARKATVPPILSQVPTCPPPRHFISSTRDYWSRHTRRARRCACQWLLSTRRAAGAANHIRARV